jgi:hypothetical protein
MARINVSISDDLKRRMDEVEDEGVNWSALAAQAFEARLAELAAKRGARSMRDVIARLRAAVGKGSCEGSARGREAGIAWASNVALPGHLETLADLLESGGEGYFAEDVENQDYPPAERFYYEVIEPDHEGRRKLALRWWSQNFEGLSDAGPSGEDVIGFAEGAQSVWEQVKDEI